jgi:hypothetical protein
MKRTLRAPALPLAALAAAAGLLALAAEPAPAGAQGTPPVAQPTSSAPAAAAPATGKPALRLDSILRPRTTPVAPPPSAAAPGGRNRAQWASTFSAVRQEIAVLQTQVEASRKRLAASSNGSEYQYSPLGGGVSTDPETLKLRAQLRRDRETLEAAERRLRDLEVEASLSGVPRAWFDPETTAPKR